MKLFCRFKINSIIHIATYYTIVFCKCIILANPKFLLQFLLFKYNANFKYISMFVFLQSCIAYYLLSSLNSPTKPSKKTIFIVLSIHKVLPRRLVAILICSGHQSTLAAKLSYMYQFLSKLLYPLHCYWHHWQNLDT